MSHSDSDIGDIPLPRHTLATEVVTTRTSTRRSRPTPRSCLAARKRARRAAQDDNLPDETDMLFHSIKSSTDTEVALLTIRAQWPGQAEQDLPSTPPIILQSQLYALVDDRAEVDREVDRLRAENVVRYVKLPGAGEDYGLVLMRDFRERAAKVAGEAEVPDVVQRLFGEVFPRCRDVSLFQADLNNILGSGDGDTTELVRLGYLTLRDEDSLWFAVPGMGSFVKHRNAGARELNLLLKRTQYKEMLLTKLELRTMKKSPFTAQWHIRDIVGGEQAETVSTSLGTLVRLRGGA